MNNLKHKSQSRYEQVERLPNNALTVKLYAEQIGVAVPHIYKLYKNGKVNIKVFQGVNFVIPN